jgi:hypothetical protein
VRPDSFKLGWVQTGGGQLFGGQPAAAVDIDHGMGQAGAVDG